ncbi:MAG: DUF975 family protein [Oscillospiraceae bacterium]|nr:DUF975 family protein [Oscillospiraceae bacterium]
MMENDLKITAKAQIRSNMPKIFIVSILYLVITSIMIEVQFKLLGVYNAFDIYFQQLLVGNLLSIFGFISLLTLNPIRILLTIAISLSIAAVRFGYTSHTLRIQRGEALDIIDLFNGFYVFGKVIQIHIITNIKILLWSLLLVIPGIIASISYRQAYYILFDDPKKSAMECINESKEMMTGLKAEFCFLYLSFLGWYILEEFVMNLLAYVFPISLPLVSIWLLPYTFITYAGFYNRHSPNSLPPLPPIIF